MGCQENQDLRETGAQLGPQGSWGTEVNQERMGSQESRDHRALGVHLASLDLQGFLVDVGPLGPRERWDLEAPQECLVFGVTKGQMVWQGSLDSLVRGDFLGLTDPLDQLGPRVSQVLQVAPEGQG